MNDRLVACFLEAARLLNFTRAAEALTLPQPAVSRYISALESELGVTLFIRESNRKITLSEAGKAYFNLFQRFGLELAHTRNLLSGGAPTLRLGYNVGWDSSEFLPAVLRRCRARYPDLQLSFQCLGFQGMIQALKDNRLDAVLSMENYLSQEPDLEVERVASIQRVILYSELLENFELIRTPSDFYSQDFFIVDDPRVQQICREAEDVFQPYHFVPRFVTVPNLDTVFAYVKNGLGVALLDRWNELLCAPKIHALNIDDHISIALAFRKHNHLPTVEILREELIRYFQG